MRIMGSQADESTINHFSHPHPLELSNHQNSLTPVLCSGCKLKATGLIYSCSTCNFVLHAKCSKMPRKITHPFDKDHVFSLLPKPLYAEGFFNCDACGEQGDGFCYHCKICNIDLHILCAVKPLNFTHQSHNHQLKLIFSPPHPGKIFNCDICNTSGSNHWLYRCDTCDFDVHLNCTNNVRPPAMPIPQVHHHIQQPGMTSKASLQAPPQASPTCQAFHPPFAAATGIPVPNFTPTLNPLNQGFHAPVMPSVHTQNNEYLLALQRLQAISAHSSQNSLNQQQYMQALLAGGGAGGGMGGFGGGVGGGVGAIGGAGGLGGMPQLLQALARVNNIPGMDLLGNGGGLNILQGLMGGGGGSVLDILGGDGALSMLNGLDLGGLLGGFSL